MTGTSQRREPPPYDQPPTSAWTGWVVFGGVVLVVMGLIHVVQGLVALLDDEYYLVTAEGLVVNVDYTTWGWVHLGFGVIGGLVGLGLLAGNLAARIAGVVIAGLSILVSIAFSPAYPIWALIVITLDVLVIYAIVVHGRELQSTY
ncbi:DUF7144 family membrane protein [Geodermatophilus marinus]|uniref:DUF7144 family membrane protein n=1 Tax=Geodermatophilus sp. LHW52908 TaxID=2303986 RepID=UPI000E3D994C|nr:hypothetical protein [Geodermatophilus sp. LHW52908]RFU22030.1 hypothetical protein D0Z06_07860 [Geodermatophilus sp. LHW52908]